MAPPSGHSWSTKASCQDNWFASQSPAPMVAHGKLTSSLRSLKLINVYRCWAKPLIPCHLCPPSNDGYLVARKLEKLWMASAAENALNSPQRRWDHIRESSNTRGVNCKVNRNLPVRWRLTPILRGLLRFLRTYTRARTYRKCKHSLTIIIVHGWCAFFENLRLWVNVCGWACKFSKNAADLGELESTFTL